MIALWPLVALAEVPPAPAVLASGVVRRVGTRLPLSALLTDQDGRTAPLASRLHGRPLVVELAWYGCTQICSVAERGLREAAEELGGLGTTWDALTVGLDPSETPEDARRARERAGATWPFTVGEPAAVAGVMDAVGIHAARDPSGVWAHPSVTVLVGGDGRVAGYLYGPRPEADELRAALDAARRGAPVRSATSWVDTCFHVAVNGGRALAFLRVGFVAICVGLFATLLRLALRRAS